MASTRTRVVILDSSPFGLGGLPEILAGAGGFEVVAIRAELSDAEVADLEASRPEALVVNAGLLRECDQIARRICAIAPVLELVDPCAGGCQSRCSASPSDEPDVVQGMSIQSNPSTAQRADSRYWNRIDSKSRHRPS